MEKPIQMNLKKILLKNNIKKLSPNDIKTIREQLETSPKKARLRQILRIYNKKNS